MNKIEELKAELAKAENWNEPWNAMWANAWDEANNRNQETIRRCEAEIKKLLQRGIRL
jgi:hypothetical protein